MRIESPPQVMRCAWRRKSLSVFLLYAVASNLQSVKTWGRLTGLLLGLFRHHRLFLFTKMSKKLFWKLTGVGGEKG